MNFGIQVQMNMHIYIYINNIYISNDIIAMSAMIPSNDIIADPVTHTL